MDLIEGVSNEVLLAFIVTILLVVIAVTYTFFCQESGVIRTQNNVDGSINNQSHINSENVVGRQYDIGDIDSLGSQSQTNVNENQTNLNESEIVNSDNVNREDVQLQNEGIRNDNIRRRMVNSEGMGQDQSTSGHNETMMVKVKHNENIQTFNVPKNITVVELKRLAFHNELIAGRRVRFVYAGQLLRNDNDPLTRYGVLPNTVVHCVITEPPAQHLPDANEHSSGEDLDISRFLLPLMTVALIMAWYGLISYKHIFSGSSIAILMFLTSLYVILVYVTTSQ